MSIAKTSWPVFLIVFALGLTEVGLAQVKKNRETKPRAAETIIWRNPGNISTLDLRYGPGSAAAAPVPPFVFVEEDKGGESPKFLVRDAREQLWSVKLGPEAQAETVATRLVWAVGYFAEEAYHFEKIQVDRLPPLSRGQEYVSGDFVRGVRFEPRRANMEKGSTWDWQKNPFAETRELSGLKILMILLNNYDARAGNNRIIYMNGRKGTREARYYVTDLGATLGKAGGFGGKRSKNNLADFLSTEFVLGTKDGVVEFDYDTRPTGLGHLAVLHPIYYRNEVKKEKAMRGIPIEHARWIGSLLAGLSDDQLRDAFRAAHYSDGVMESYVQAFRERINQLTELSTGRDRQSARTK